MGAFFNTFLIWPILNILVVIYQALLALHVPYPLGFAIIVLTVVIRIVLYPLTRSQLSATQKMQTIAPHINALKEKHKNDAQKLQAETMRLYKEHGVNPVAGCLPVLIQFPIIISLYNVLNQVVSTKQALIVSNINSVLYFPSLHLRSAWDQHFFGLPLGQAPSHLFSTFGPLILLFPALTAAFQFVQSKMMFPQSKPSKKDEKSASGKNNQLSTKQTEKKTNKDDFAAAFQSQSLYLLPLIIGFTSYNFPIGLSLYWNTFTIFGIIQQYQMQGLGGLTEWKEKIFNKKSNGK